jgi:xanthine dehydrogenase small subunit
MGKPADVTVKTPTQLDDALRALAEDPSTTILAGGTDLMVGVNAGARRPTNVLSLRRVEELRAWHRDGSDLVIGAGTTYSTILGSEL